MMKEVGTPMDNDFPARLRKLRESKRPVYSMIKTGEFIGLDTPGMLRRYERGEAEPKLSQLKLIANYYGVTLDYLVYGKKL